MPTRIHYNYSAVYRVLLFIYLVYINVCGRSKFADDVFLLLIVDVLGLYKNRYTYVPSTVFQLFIDTPRTWYLLAFGWLWIIVLALTCCCCCYCCCCYCCRHRCCCCCRSCPCSCVLLVMFSLATSTDLLRSISYPPGGKIGNKMLHWRTFSR